MICHKCGSENLARAAHCSICGAMQIALPEGAGIAPIPAALLTPRAPKPAARAPEAEEPLAGAFDADAYAAAIGPKATDYYLDEFEKLHDGRSAAWHWPAFFFTLFWLMRRRMWGKAAIYFGASWALSLLAGVMYAVSAPLGVAYQLAMAIGFFVVPAIVANRLYFRHCTRLIEQASKSARNRDQALGIVSGRGGTSNGAFVLAVIFVLIFGFGIVAAVALPAYQDYTMRAKASEVVVAMAPSRVAVHEFYERTGRLPTTLQETGVGYPSASRYGSPVEYDAATGTISTRATLSNTVSASIVMKPFVSNDGRLSWACGSPDLAAKYLPASCRAKV